MKYKIEIWTIRKLQRIYASKKLILNPPYQRNPIWSLTAQKMLIDTIKCSQPIPNFFLLKKDGLYEMVDGQQRARTMLGYWQGDFADNEGIIFDKDFKKEPKNKIFLEKFLDYELNITLIAEINDNESIEAFYSLVNSSGLRLNRPELKKAEFYGTNFLRLITTLSDSQDFKDLRLFTSMSSNRMNDVDFVAELIALTKHGISDKKDKVDEMFENDISDEDYAELASSFKKVVGHFLRFNKICPLKGTRFSQKNDFYTLYDFINSNSSLDNETFDYFFRLLLKISNHIKPSQEHCDPLMNYALNCVTQSNSKLARLNRQTFLIDFLLNQNPSPNQTQMAIMAFYKLTGDKLVKKKFYYTLDLSAMKDPDHPELPL